METQIANYLTQLGVGGIFVILVLKEVFNFLTKLKLPKNGSSADPGSTASNIIKMISQSQENSLRSLEKAIDRLTENIDRQSDLLQKLFVEIKETSTSSLSRRS